MSTEAEQAKAEAQQAYVMQQRLRLSQASAPEKVGWYTMTGQLDQANAWANVAKVQTGLSLLMGGLQITMAHAIESAPGVEPPPPPKIPEPTAASVQADTEALAAADLARIEAERIRRENLAATQDVRTSVSTQEAMHRGLQRGKQAVVEGARSAAIEAAGQQRALIAQQKWQYEQLKFQKDREDAERARQADSNRLAAWGALGGKVLSSLPSLIAMMSGIDSAQAKAMGTTVEGLKAMRAASAAYEKENKILMQMEQARKDDTFRGDVKKRLQNEYAKARAKRDALGERAADLGVTNLPWVEVEAKLATDRAAAAEKLGPVVLTQPATTTISPEDAALAAAMAKRKVDKEVAEGAGALGAFKQDPSLASTYDTSELASGLEGGIGDLRPATGKQIGAGGLAARNPGLGSGGTAGALPALSRQYTDAAGTVFTIEVGQPVPMGLTPLTATTPPTVPTAQ